MKIKQIIVGLTSLALLYGCATSKPKPKTWEDYRAAIESGLESSMHGTRKSSPMFASVTDEQIKSLAKCIANEMVLLATAYKCPVSEPIDKSLNDCFYGTNEEITKGLTFAIEVLCSPEEKK